MERQTILVNRLYKSVAPTKYCFKGPEVLLCFTTCLLCTNNVFSCISNTFRPQLEAVLNGLILPFTGPAWVMNVHIITKKYYIYINTAT